ncbi:MAG: dihydroorotase [Bacteroidales bacterium]|jgi:dihydroorotase|nr:dihydroorotase [Bacteroidales bacterium]
MSSLLLLQGTIVTAGEEFVGSIYIENQRIAHIFRENVPQSVLQTAERSIYCNGMFIFPGVIDDQVHFREPGLTHKATIASESQAALAGGVTTFMEMPNTIPQTTTIPHLEEKLTIAHNSSFANYAFYFGATNDNIDHIKALDSSITCGLKLFMGSSTGNMLVDNEETLSQIFKESRLIIAAHCENEEIIQANLAAAKAQFGDTIPIEWHPKIRSREACYTSSHKAIELARKYNARLHVLHLSTADELALFESGNVRNKLITNEVCVHHLWFNDTDYARKGALIKWNPAIKTEADRKALFSALLSDTIDIVATDHAPHTLAEKTAVYTKAASGGPLVQHSLLAMLDFYEKQEISLTQIVNKMCHAPADLFAVKERGYLREGFFADIVVVNPHKQTPVTKESLLYACKWSPFEGHTFSHAVEYTILNGAVVYEDAQINPQRHAMQVEFNR